MGSAKAIVLRPISAAEANAVVKREHYSGKVVQNSQFHIGVFHMGRLEGAMSFGPSLDGAQCGDGTIYRASGFVLTSIKENSTVWRGPDVAPDTLPIDLRRAYAAYVARHGAVFHQMTLQGGERHSAEQQALRAACYGFTRGAPSVAVFAALGCAQIPGYQFRYVRFLDPAWASRLTVPVIPFDQIPAECRMYRGQRGGPSGPPGDHPGEGGATPTPPLHGSGGVNE